jgi:hypothetical protein
MPDSRYDKLGTFIHDNAEIPGPVTDFHRNAARQQIMLVEQAKLVVIDPDSPPVRRELIEQLTHLMREHEGKTMYNADKWATQAVNNILATLRAQAWLNQNGDGHA